MRDNAPLYACEGKQRFNTFREGELVIKRMRRYHRDRKEPMNLYRCPYCPGWHIGRKTKNG